MELPEGPKHLDNVVSYQERWERKQRELAAEATKAKTPKQREAAAAEIRSFATVPLPGGAGAPIEAPRRDRRGPDPDAPVRPVRRCPLALCDGSGWLVWGDEASSCECRKRRHREIKAKRLGRLDGPSASLDAPPLSGLEPDVRAELGVIARALGEGEQAIGSLWIRGGSGTGRTSACRLLAAAALEGGRSTTFESTLRLVWQLRARAAGGGEGAASEAIYEELAEVDVLVLDDLDGLVERRDDRLELRKAKGDRPAGILSPGYRAIDVARICELVDARFRELRPTIVGTSLSPELLAEELQTLGRVDLVREVVEAAVDGRAPSGEVTRIRNAVEQLVGQLLDGRAPLELG